MPGNEAISMLVPLHFNNVDVSMEINTGVISKQIYPRIAAQTGARLGVKAERNQAEDIYRGVYSRDGYDQGTCHLSRARIPA